MDTTEIPEVLILRGVLAGSLWAIGIFLMSYRGYQKRDEMAGRLACVFALGVALFPTARARHLRCRHLFRLDHGGCDAAHVISGIVGWPRSLPEYGAGEIKKF
jgi:hypothetical protein